MQPNPTTTRVAVSPSRRWPTICAYLCESLKYRGFVDSFASRAEGIAFWRFTNIEFNPHSTTAATTGCVEVLNV
eukprot:4592202-Lingulodinium_polyedra.AAC.1